MSYNRDQGNFDFLTMGKTFVMCKREKGLSDDKILAKYYNFSHFWGPDLGTNQIVGNSEEYFCCSREHGVEFPGTGELRKSEFRGTPSFIFEEQGNGCKFS